MNEQVEALKIEKKLESLEVKLTFLIVKKVEEVLKVSCKVIQNSYSKIAAKNVEIVSTRRPLPEAHQKQILNHNISSTREYIGSPRISIKRNMKILPQPPIRLTKHFQKFGFDTKVEELRSLGKFDKNRKKFRTVPVTFKHSTRNTKHAWC